MTNRIIASLIAILVVLFIVLSFYNPIKKIEIPTVTTTIYTTTTIPIQYVESHEVTIFVPAVDEEGNGAALPLTVEAQSGKGRVLTNINEILVWWTTTQESIQIAKSVAEDLTKLNLSNYDLIYTLETTATIIEGPSAGAALTIATLAALENKSINQSVMITGTINPDGTIGPVGGILSKAKAAKDIGATLFLVPEGQGVQTSYVPGTQCETIGRYQYCRTEYNIQKVDITKEAGITVKEVSNIDDALKYFVI
jgi:uncharacterized protein